MRGTKSRWKNASGRGSVGGGSSGYVSGTGAGGGLNKKLFKVKVMVPDLDGGDDKEAWLTIRNGFCICTDPELKFCFDLSAPWIKWHFVHRKWMAVIVVEKPPEPSRPSVDSQAEDDDVAQLGLDLD